MSPRELPDTYPPELEAAWLTKAEEATGRTADDALEVLRADVQKLSDLFTVGRPDGSAEVPSRVPLRRGLRRFSFRVLVHLNVQLGHRGLRADAGFRCVV